MFNIYSVAIKSILRELVVTAECTLIGLDHGNNKSSGGKATKCNRYANLLLPYITASYVPIDFSEVIIFECYTFAL